MRSSQDLAIDVTLVDDILLSGYSDNIEHGTNSEVGPDMHFVGPKKPRWYELASQTAALTAVLFVLALFSLPTPCEGASDSHAGKAEPADVLPSGCLEAGKKSQEISRLLTTVSNHPSAPAFNVLGILYGRKKQPSCAVAAFRLAIRLDPSLSEAHYNLALALVPQGDLPSAANELRAASKQKPDMFLAHNALGLVLQKRGDLDGAVEEFQTALKIKPEFAYAAANLASVLHLQKKYPAEILYLHQALGINHPRDLDYGLRLSLGLAYEANGNNDEAIAALKALVASYPKSSEAHYNLATLCAKTIRYGEAAEEFQQALKLDPQNLTARLSLAKALLEVGGEASVGPLLQVYIRHRPKDYEGYYVLGRAYRMHGEYTKAVESLRRAAELKPDDYDVRFNLGLALSHQDRLDEATQELEIAKKLNPHAPEAPYQLSLIFRKKKELGKASKEMQAFSQAKEWSRRGEDAAQLGAKGNALLDQGDPRGAAAAYREALKLTPDDARMHYNLSLALDRLGDVREEERELEQSVALDPNSVEARNQLGILYMADGKLAEAEREFKAALSTNPANAEAENNLGSLYVRLGKNSEAIPLFQKATTDDPKYSKAFLNWGIVLARQEDYPGAIQLFQKAIQLSPTYADAYTVLGMAKGKAGRNKEAIEAFTKVLELKPNSADAHVNLGIALADQYDLQGALKEFTRAIQLHGNSGVAHYNKAKVLYDMGKREQARAEAETAYSLVPDYPELLYLRGLVERNAGNFAASAEAFEKLVSLQPDNGTAQFILGQNLLHLGKQEAAIKHLKAAVAVDPANRQAVYALSRALSKANDPAAKTYLERFQELEKQDRLSDRVQVLNNFALQAAQDKNWTQAVDQLKEALQQWGECRQLPVLHRNLGLIYARTGDVENGLRELHIALKLNPNDSDATKAIDILESLRNKKPQP